MSPRSRPWFVEWARQRAPFLLFGPDSTELYLPFHMSLYLGAGLVAMIMVSLLTERVDSERLDRFYEALRTPVEAGEIIEQPLRLPRGREPAPQRKLIDRPDWEIQRPTRRGWIGFFIAWVLVGLLIALVAGLTRIGA